MVRKVNWSICFIKFCLLISILLIIYGCESYQEKVNSQKEPDSKIITNFLSQPTLANASIGIFAIDLNSGETLLEYNPNLSLVPASSLKIVSSAATLETFGPDYRFKTILAYSGKISEAKTLDGDLVILGGGDPAFLSPLFNDHYKKVLNDMVQEIKNSGIRWVNGNIIGDGSYFGQPQIADTWIWEDIGNYYGSPAYGLNIYDNTYTISFETKSAGSPAKIISITPPLPGIEFENFVTAANNSRDNAYIFGSYLSDKRIIKGTIPQNRKAFAIKGSMPDPALLAANQLLSELKKNGVGVNGAAKSNYIEQKKNNFLTLLEIDSPPLSEIIFQLNMKSINLYAENLLLHLATTYTENCTVDAGCNALSEFWKSAGMEMSGLHIEDGSGLSRANSITAEQLVHVLQFMKTNSKNSESFIRSLPVAGESGSLKSFGKGTILEGNLKAKSGYMSRVMNYTGYLTTASGRELAFAVMVNNYNCSNTEMRDMLKEFFLSVYEMEDIPKVK
jgi:D-alanyl-D-alanine carboxypeptidase/D-alanyl-D-alanine-endopeptidase (penicillin-binding protein 4)